MLDKAKLVYRNLKDRRLRTFLTMIGIFIGIAAVVSLISLGQGLEQAIRDEFIGLGGNTITIQPKGQGFGPPGTLAASKLTDDDLETVQRVRDVQSAFGRLIKPVTVQFNDETETVFTATLPEDTEDRAFLFEARSIEPAQGRLLEPDDNGVMVGHQYFEEETFGRPIRAGDKVTLNNKTFDVTAVLSEAGAPEIDISFQINEERLRDLLQIPEEYSAIVARTDPDANVTAVSHAITRALRNDRNVDRGEEDFTVETPQELFQQFNTIILIVQAVLVGIAAISLLVGGVGITNTMFTSVVERTSEIGIMKAVGARNSDILQIFLIESAALGLVGGIIGVTLGVALSKAVEILVNAAGFALLTTSYSPALIIGSLVFSTVIGVIAGVVPAIRASRMQPVEALRA